MLIFCSRFEGELITLDTRCIIIIFIVIFLIIVGGCDLLPLIKQIAIFAKRNCRHYAISSNSRQSCAIFVVENELTSSINDPLVFCAVV